MIFFRPVFSMLSIGISCLSVLLQGSGVNLIFITFLNMTLIDLLLFVIKGILLLYLEACAVKWMNAIFHNISTI